MRLPESVVDISGEAVGGYMLFYIRTDDLRNIDIGSVIDVFSKMKNHNTTFIL